MLKMLTRNFQVPHILGLTASPVMRSDPHSLTKIEETLDAICRTPMKHREELRLQVKLPVLSHVVYQPLAPDNSLASYTKTIDSLSRAFRELKISDDPYVIALLQENTDKSRRKLEKVRMNHKTWCNEQMKTLHSTTLKICSELGAWAADYYAYEVITKVMESADEADTSLGVWDVTSAEKQYLARALKGVDIRSTCETPASIPLVTDKARKLIEILVRKSMTVMFSGIVFVQERALAAVLAHLLTVHPDTRKLFRVGTIVGTSTHYRARNIGELNDTDAQKSALSLFKSGRINLVIATSVLEEGIDVPACNIVVCFQKPANLKSFVQRRGRARHRDSELILLVDSVADKATEWQQLELDMRRIYMDEMRTLEEVLRREDAEEHDNRTFEVSNTGALLDSDNAVAHLYHFCATLPAKDYADLRPEFICSEDKGGLVRAKVILPLSVNEKVRIAESRDSWMCEKNAMKDAAFEAYIALYRAGLVNDNLLPLLRHDAIEDELTMSTVEKRASIVIVHEQLNPWIEIARAWTKSEDSNVELYQATITVGTLDIQTYLPIPIPDISPFQVYWDANTELLVTCTGASAAIMANSGDISKIWDDTWSILGAAFGARFAIHQRRVVMPFTTNLDISLMQQKSRQPVANEILFNHEHGLIRDRLDSQVAYIFRGFLPNKPPVQNVQNPYGNYDGTADGPHISLTRLPRRLDFLHKIIPGSGPMSSKPYSAVLPVERCTDDSVPFKFVQFGLLVPSIMHRFGVHLLAKALSATLLKEVAIPDLSLIVTAISASSANEATNYQRLEFLGDSILKLCTSVQLIGEYPLWHEGYLSAKKDRIISNGRLSRAAVEISLDSFIITRPFTGHKWRPSYLEDLLEPSPDASRDMSTKVLADVVEALIGAAMVSGGLPNALQCLQVFLPELEWKPLATRRSFLFQRAPDIDLPATLHPLEDLIGYKFKKKALLVEAMTHASYRGGSESLERFEFLGDAILDYIIVTAMYGQEIELSHIQMHHLRTSLVNADILAFMCIEWSIEQEIVDLELDTSTTDQDESAKFTEKVIKVSLPLWRFLRHMSPTLGAVQLATSIRHAELRGLILEAFESGTHYPWALLARLQAQKFFSDMVESLIGAVWIDSGSFETCTEIVERIGILPYLRRILKDGVHILHPKEELGMLADTESVRYVISSKNGDVNEGRVFLCTVFVGDVEVVEVGGGVSQEEVKTKAAEMAVEILKIRKGGAEGGQMNVEETVQGETMVDVAMKDEN